MEGFGTFITESSTPFTMQLLTKVSEEFGFRNFWLLDGWFNYLYGLRPAKTTKISNIVFKKLIKHFLNVVVNSKLWNNGTNGTTFFGFVLGYIFFVGFFNANLKVCPFLLLTLAMHL